ncbi:MAG: exodeoxyribonuclease V subunit alpha [Candidatus Lambdaproteobacteria bacterium RIFOXYD1_FULL_56_27]|uniref:RecBCD enzyme subunit RecD n=1 Tax=Candidatus Lambdaproteobacteria bacterium RIFOXYD2_FULL_56_26 TaxID=1817773 RepID=A0A1F6H3C3_9PROT|nr:MAG: exodeoxyribonuclease V subunit alpha [Candidatus Lambdaproteobacteria bacterium RIFOXYD2_FULL_56_26]OGH09344.1 MAG: exodeoxyribonuclease V subunit alpha [Candidatus Lambdaproteobacteria bacterium RIFOXYD1_FULL_56_27]
MRWNLINLAKAKLLSSLDRQFALHLAGPGQPAELYATLALVRRSLGLGHIGCALEDLCQSRYLSPDGPLEFEAPAVEELLKILSRTSFLGGPGDYRPLVLEGGLLYLHKYHRYQQRLITLVRERLDRPSHSLDPATLADLDRWFPTGPWEGQKLAAGLALAQEFFLLTGGPGTGKTTTAFWVLTLAQARRLRSGKEPLKLALLAPTGKAAARLSESVAAQLAHHAPALDPLLAACLKVEAQTIHRFLGFLPQGQGRFLYHQENQSDRELVLVDEASMVDLPLFVKLLEAIPLGAQVILMGDPDQLAAVESGAVFKDLTQDQDLRRPSVRLKQSLPPAVELGALGPKLLDHRLRLTYSHRFAEQTGIGQLAQALRTGDETAWDHFVNSGDLAQKPASSPLQLGQSLELWVKEQEPYRPLLNAKDPSAALGAIKRVQLLCALREGPFGVSGLNRRLQELLFPGTLWDQLPIRPILITANDPDLGLFNGDPGVILGGQAWFEGPQGPRAVALSLLPPHEPAFALTVHKSQGSEYEEVALVLPPTTQEILSLELLYTALTRAKKRFLLLGERPVFEGALKVRSTRRSGLREALWGEGEG